MSAARPTSPNNKETTLLRRRVRRLERTLEVAREFVGNEADMRGPEDKQYPLPAGKLLRRIENVLFAEPSRGASE